MSLAFKRIKVYIKSGLVLIVALAIGAVLIENRNHAVRFWFFGLVDSAKEINVLWLILCTALGSVLSWSVLWMAVGLVKDARELRRQRQLRRWDESQKELADKLREQEKRIDEKIGKAIGQNAEKE